MRRLGAIFLAVVFLSGSTFARQNQNSAGPPQQRAPFRATPNSGSDCDGGFDALSRVWRAAERGARLAAVQADPSDAKDKFDPTIVSPQDDEARASFEQNQREIVRCTLMATVQPHPENASGGCSAELLMNFEMRHDGEPEQDIPIERLPGTEAFFYEAGMTIDADGAPNAYHPENLGLDDLANAGAPGSWAGLAKNADGEPFIQGPDDPFPGYYVSETALADRSKAVNDPTRYVDASRIPFVVLPGGMARELGARPGDFAVVFNERNGRSSYAIFGDVGPFDRIGEGSMALAEILGIWSDARRGGARRGILYLVFPGSGNRSPRTIEEIDSEGQKLLTDWLSAISEDACPFRQSRQTLDGNGAAN